MRSDFTDAGGVRTHYRRAGPAGGVPLVMLHGLGGSGDDWGDCLSMLARGRPVIAPDLLGCGRTAGSGTRDFGPQAMRDHVLALLDALGLERVDLDGWSMGGRIALDLAAAAPDRVRRLVVSAPAGIGPDSIVDFTAPAPRVAGQLLSRPPRLVARVLRNAARAGTGGRVLGFAARRVRMFARHDTRAAFRAQMASFLGPEGFSAGPRDALTDRLSAVAAPTLALWGRQDMVVPCSHAAILRAALPRCEVRILERCGHMMQYERPRAYVAAVQRFLDAAD